VGGGHIISEIADSCGDERRAVAHYQAVVRSAITDNYAVSQPPARAGPGQRDSVGAGGGLNPQRGEAAIGQQSTIGVNQLGERSRASARYVAGHEMIARA